MRQNDSPAFTPGFLEDIFISYAHADEGSEKWVSTFCALLQEKLEYELRGSVRVWFDSQLAAGDVLDSALKKRIQSSALMIPIISPWYFDRPWCQREMTYFLQAVEGGQGLLVGTSSRLIPVIKREVQANNWPKEIRDVDMLVARFYEGNRNFPPAVDGISEFFQRVEKLAGDLKALLESMKEQAAAQQQAETVLVLAPMSGVLDKEEAHLRNWLAHKQRAVGPTGPLPRTRNEILSMFAGLFEKTNLIVHLLGSIYDMLPAGERQLSVEELLVNAARQSGKRQLVWIEKEDLEDERQAELVQRIKGMRDNQTELITGEFSRFLESLPEELEKSRPAPEVHDEGIYLICDKPDLAHPDCTTLRSYLAAQGFPLTLPSFQGDPEARRALEAEQILSHDVTLIYFGTAPDTWAEQKRSDSRKVLLSNPAQHRPKRAIYLAPPDEEGLKYGKYGPYIGSFMPEMGKMSILVVGGLGAFEAERLKPLWKE